MTLICKVCYESIAPGNEVTVKLDIGMFGTTQVIDPCDDFCSWKCVAIKLEEIANQLRLNPALVLNIMGC